MASTPSADAAVAVIGGGVVGAAVAYALARRGVAVVVLEAEPELALGASGTNSGILHTGFDSPPDTLETRLILRSAALRTEMVEDLGVGVLRCGGLVRAADASQARSVAALAAAARHNGVDVRLESDEELEVPGEAVTDPAAYTLALAAGAASGGAEVRTGARVEAIERDRGRRRLSIAAGGRVVCGLAVNCAGLRGDDVARMAGDDSFEVRPRKGEFFVFEPPAGRRLERILLPVPTKRTKGVLVFPTVDGKVVAGPTAHDQRDKSDWSVREQAWEEVVPAARRLWPPLEEAEPIDSYAGLRPAGLPANYLIGRSGADPGLINVAAIRSTGLSASLGIGEHVASLVGAAGVALGTARRLRANGPQTGEPGTPWWRRAARYRGGAA